MKGIAIIPVPLDDVQAIAALAREVWYATYPGIISTGQIEYMLGQRYTPEVIRREIENHDAAWDELRDDGKLVAFISYFPADSAGDLKVDKLYVAKTGQRKGYGGRLLDHAARTGRDRGFEHLILAVNKKNEQAINAYRKHGFRVREAVTKDIGEGFVMDDFIMERAIGASSQ